LRSNGNTVLKRVVRLLRVACMTTPTWASEKPSLEWTFNVPDGTAWLPTLRLVDRNLSGLAPEDRLMLLGLVEDSLQNVSCSEPDVPGAEHVAGIAHWLLPIWRGVVCGSPFTTSSLITTPSATTRSWRPGTGRVPVGFAGAVPLLRAMLYPKISKNPNCIPH
jgi:hypothetical protein